MIHKAKEKENNFQPVVPSNVTGIPLRQQYAEIMNHDDDDDDDDDASSKEDFGDDDIDNAHKHNLQPLKYSFVGEEEKYEDEEEEKYENDDTPAGQSSSESSEKQNRNKSPAVETSRTEEENSPPKRCFCRGYICIWVGIISLLLSSLGVIIKNQMKSLKQQNEILYTSIPQKSFHGKSRHRNRDRNDSFL